MPKVKVSRQRVDEGNQIHWDEQEIEESELQPHERPVRNNRWVIPGERPQTPSS